MKALAKTGPAPGVELIDVPEPRPGPGEVLVEVQSCGLCGTDLHIYRSEAGLVNRLTFPRVLGHEPVGVVREVGPGVDGFRPGDRVAGEPHAACGRCETCREGFTELCDRATVMGGHRDGALAPLVAAPAGCFHHIPSDLDTTAAALLEPLSVGVYAVDLARLRPGEAVVVLGPGPVGLATALAARASGAARTVVVGLDLDAGRLELAARLGFPGITAGGGVTPDDGSLWERLANLLGGKGPHVVFDTTGALPEVPRIVRRGGRVVLIGWPHRGLLPEELRELFLRSVTLLSLRWRPPGIWPRVIALLSSGGLDPRPLVTHTLPLDEALHAFELLQRREAMKVVVVPR